MNSGDRLGPYTIVAPLGAGGMGEVFRAHDSRLDRDVAIKLLPVGFRTDASRLARFEQEAKATSALNHPNILTVYDFGEHEGAPFIVAELLEGAGLRARLNDGPIPRRTAIAYAQQIVSGLSAAHDKGIVHRDLKPENLFVTHDDRVKILDFGLAKALAPNGAGTRTDETRLALTVPGVVMGTAGYMSPEQVRGQAADPRSDIFAFGLVLHEMITGKQAFGRDTMAETMAAILREEPEELSHAQPPISPQLERVVRRCLEKKPERRFQSTADLGFALEGLATPTGASDAGLASAATAAVSATTRSASRAWLPWIAAGVLALVTAIALGLTYANRSVVDRSVTGGQPVRLSFVAPADVAFNDTRADAAVISPDGQKVAFSATRADGKSILYVRALASGETTLLTESPDTPEPFWSPDSRSIAFGSLGKLKRIDLSGGSPQVLCDAARMTGGTWNSSGVIVFGSDYGSTLFQVPATGGEPKAVTTFDEARGDGQHRNPYFLPDGRHFLFTSSGSNTTADTASAGVWVGSIDSTELKRILPDVTKAVYASPGWLVFIRNQILVAQAFDADRLQTSGDPIPVIRAPTTDAGIVRLSVSTTGVLMWQPSWERKYQLVWYDRTGRQLGTMGDPSLVTVGQEPTLSPDGKRVVLKRDGNILVCDLTGNSCIRLGRGQLPAWSPDNSRVTFSSNSAARSTGIVQRAANGVGDPELLLAGTIYPEAWSPDGRFLLYVHRGVKTRMDLWMLPRPGPGVEYPLLASAANELLSAFSPDGHWLAYVSDDTGTNEIYVQSFTADGKLGSDRKRVSAGGGVVPVWRRDGQELFFVAGDGQLMSAAVAERGPTIEFGAPRPLFKTRMLESRSVFHEFDVTPDGQRFVVGTMIGAPTSPPPTVIVNWMASLK